MHIRDKYIAHYETEERHEIAEMTGAGIHWKFTHFDSQTKLDDFTV